MEANIRIGHGFDVHRLVSGRNLILGGVTIPHSLGLLGHSDADVLTHAIMDAMLGAAGLGDIGRHFPDTDEAYRDADSIELLRRVTALLDEQGYYVQNLDATVIAQSPKLAPFLPQMRTTLADAIHITPAAVNIKATTTEGLGYAGRGEGIAAHCVCLIAR